MHDPQKAMECRFKAQQLRMRAANAKRDEEREQYRKLAEEWDRRADEFEKMPWEPKRTS